MSLLSAHCGVIVSNQKCRFCSKLNLADSRYCNACGNDLTFAIPADGLLPPGTVLRGSYVIEKVIGEGGMGVVYSCHHKTLGTGYALKVLDAKLARMEILRNRFLVEAKIQANVVVHPHIVRVMDVIDGDKDGGLPGVLAIVMEYIDGSSLDQIIESHRLSIYDAVSSALVILDAIGYAHKAEIVHRDLKPSNIMISEREAKEALHKGVKVMDFGIAKELQENAQRTMTGAKMGTPRYMAPEQIQNARNVDRRTDIYAIGLTLYELLCGRTPFEEYREFELFRAQIEFPPPPMHQFRKDVGDRLEAIVMKALEKDPANRYQSAEEFQRALLSLGGYDEIPLLLKPYDGVVVPSTNQKLQRKIGQAIDRSKIKPPATNATQKQTAASTAKFVKNSEFKTEAPAPRTSSGQSILAISAQRAQANNETPSHTFRRRDISSDLYLRKKTKGSEKRSPKPSPKSQAAAAAEARAQSLDRALALATTQASQEKAKTRATASPKTQVQGQMIPNGTALSVSLEAPPEKHAHRSRFALKLVLLILVALAGFGLYYRFINEMPQPTVQVEVETSLEMATSGIPEDVSKLELRQISTETGRMSLVPRAKHWISTKNADEIRQVQLDAFVIDQVETSHYQYQKCVAAQKCPPLGIEVVDLNLPVTGIGYGSAEAFCRFAGKRLPTAQEWEAAARFGGKTNGITYVNVGCDRIHYGASPSGECKRQNPARPESVFLRAQSANPAHLLNMLGNVREWTSTPSDTSPQRYITKGGSYRSPKAEINIGVNKSAAINAGEADLGFRCVKSI